MAKANNQTTQNEGDVEAFLQTVADERQRADSFKLLEIFKKVTGEKPKMWGPAIIGFGLRHLKYESGRELDWMLIGFSPRKGNLTLYLGLGSPDGQKKFDDLLARLGKHKTGKGCLYINKLSNIDEPVLEELVSASVEHIKNSG